MLSVFVASFKALLSHIGGAAASLLHFVFHREREDEKEEGNTPQG
jgi:hypothetical protein